MKKLFALLLCAAMLLSMAACGTTPAENPGSTDGSVGNVNVDDGKEQKDPVVLEMFFAGNGIQSDTQKVEDRVNELLKSYEGLEHVSIHI